jgi:hypothetical protein
MNRGLLIVGVALGAITGVVAVRPHQSAAAPFSAPASAMRSTLSDATGAAMLSTEARRLQELRLHYETVMALLQIGDYGRARELLASRRERHGDAPSIWRALDERYGLLADCLEQPTQPRRKRVEALLVANATVALASELRAACAVSAR